MFPPHRSPSILFPMSFIDRRRSIVLQSEINTPDSRRVAYPGGTACTDCGFRFSLPSAAWNLLVGHPFFERIGSRSKDFVFQDEGFVCMEKEGLK